MGIAAQFTLTRVRSRRALRLWMARAISSFPVPVSPKRRMVESVGDTVCNCSRTFFKVGLSPIISSKLYSVRISSCR